MIKDEDLPTIEAEIEAVDCNPKNKAEHDCTLIYFMLEADGEPLEFAIADQAIVQSTISQAMQQGPVDFEAVVPVIEGLLSARHGTAVTVDFLSEEAVMPLIIPDDAFKETDD